jgi:hypothetical protein
MANTTHLHKSIVAVEIKILRKYANLTFPCTYLVLTLRPNLITTIACMK